MKDKLQSVNDGFEISNHRFLNMVANGISALVQEAVPKFVLKYTGKSSSDNRISAVLIGEKTFATKNDLDDASDKIKSIMRSIKNPSDLISALKE